MRFIAERPYIISLILIVLVGIWMLSPSPESTTDKMAEATANRLQKVQVKKMSAETTALELVFAGRTEANLWVEIASELDGKLLSFKSPRGTQVKREDSIAHIDAGSLETALIGAHAELSRAQLDYDAQSKLYRQGTGTRKAKVSSFAALKTAYADVQALEMELSKTIIRAPFDGLIADHHVEVGDFMETGEPLATLINLDFIRAAGDVAERDIAGIELGGSANVIMLNGEKFEGEITYISPFADEQSRTFRVEVTLANTNGNLVVGMTTKIAVPIRSVSAHKISPALLTLNAEGDVQIATVDANDRVELFEVELVRSESDGIWVRGIPDGARVITLGQGFVYHGDLVEPIDSKITMPAVATNN